jgi:hypothetical protein
MRISEELVYDAPLASVQAMLFDPAFREEVLAAQKVVRSNVSVSTDGDDTLVELEQTQATDSVPSFVRKFTGDEITITSTERWTSPTHAVVSSTIPGAPGGVEGTNDLVDEGERTRMRVVREINVNVPLIGGKLAKFVASMHTKALAKEHQAAQAWLAD